MNVAGLIENYGYLAVAAGAFFEGETILILAGFAAYRAHLDLPTVIMVAVIASVLGDLAYFHAGRRFGPALLVRFPSWQAKTARVKGLLQRHHVPAILTLRLFYGLRTPGLLAIGMSEVCAFRFLALSCISATVWSIAVAGIGFLFGQAIERLLVDFGEYQMWVMGALFLLGTVWYVLSRRRAAGK